ncbi:C40 family peptidase [Serinicoccus profundi]|uniref:C40 family peptidase n=1 Tax=Serinicoccus profundi TaxID=1078471 RepID=UPI000255EACD|nr:C40 family peptidase [Serinicoccus profundi]
MTQRITGRHRRPGRLRTTSSTLTRTAAVAATSTGLLAGAALSANATPEVAKDREAIQRLGMDVSADRTVTVDRPAQAVAAPSDVELESFGIGGFTAYTPEVEVEVPVVAEAAPVQEQAAAPVEEQAAAPVQEQVSTREETSASRTNERAATPEPVVEAEPVVAAEPEPEPAAPAPSGGVLGVAAGLTGTPYQWGGSTPAGFDCSGFTSYVFAQVGISLPRTAAQQQAFATPVSNPQPGDLVFYGYPAYHIGIYAGDGMMYDSPRPGKVLDLRPVFDGVSGYGRVG